jgi:hypothetical protein
MKGVTVHEPTPAGTGSPNNTFGVLALVLGIASLPLVLCFGIGLVSGIAAVILGGLGLHRVNQGQATNRGQAMAGLVCGAIAVLAVIVIIVVN